MVTKRNAVITALATVVAALAGRKTEAAPVKSNATFDGTVINSSLYPIKIYLALDDGDGNGGVSSIEISYKGETTTLTPEEIMEALAEVKQDHARSPMGNDRPYIPGDGYRPRSSGGPPPPPPSGGSSARKPGG